MAETQTRAFHGVFLSWTTTNGRTADLAHRLGIQPEFIAVGRQRRATAPLRWIAQSVLSLPAVSRGGVDAVVLMLPPYPALLLCRVVCRLRRIPLIVDAHSAVFEDPRWQRFVPSTLKHLRKCTLTIVTNRHHRELLERAGVACVELHDPPARLPPVDPVAPDGHVLVPASWHQDEPLSEIVDVARTHPDERFVLTGRPAPTRLASLEPLPDNVTLSGFVSDAEYADLVAGASIICCLTTNDHTMQRGGYEALAAGIPLLTSDFALLRDYFGVAATYAAPHSDSIDRALAEILADRAGFAVRMSELRRRTTASYEADLDTVRSALGPGATMRPPPVAASS